MTTFHPLSLTTNNQPILRVAWPRYVGLPLFEAITVHDLDSCWGDHAPDGSGNPEDDDYAPIFGMVPAVVAGLLADTERDGSSYYGVAPLPLDTVTVAYAVACQNQGLVAEHLRAKYHALSRSGRAAFDRHVTMLQDQGYPNLCELLDTWAPAITGEALALDLAVRAMVDAIST